MQDAQQLFSTEFQGIPTYSTLFKPTEVTQKLEQSTAYITLFYSTLEGFCSTELAILFYPLAWQDV